MADLKTNYKDRLLDTSVNTERKFNLVDSGGNVIASGVSLRDITQYSQEGDTFGAADINKITATINEQNNNLGGLSFYEDEEGNKYVVGADAVPKKLGSGINIPMFEVISTADLYGTSNLKFDVTDCDSLKIATLETLKGTGYITITGNGSTLYSNSGNFLKLSDIALDISSVSEINIYIRAIGAGGQVATLSIYDMNIE